MSVVFHAGFDDLPAASFTLDGWSANVNSVVAGAVDGNRARLTNTSTGNRPRIALPGSYATAIAGFAWRITGFATTNTIFTFVQGATAVASVQVIAGGGGGQLRILNAAGTTVATGSTILATNTDYYIEFKVTVGTSGTAEIKLNGVTEIAAATGNYGTPSITGFQFSNANSNASTALSGDFDDLYVIDTGTSPNTGYLATANYTPHVQTLYPDSDGAHTQWTPDTGTAHFSRVNEVTPDGDTSYVSDNTPGDRDSYSVGNTAFALSNIVAVKGRAYARTDAANTLAIVARPTSTDRDGATKTLTASYAMYSQYWETNPDTSAAWTQSDVDGSEFGVKLVA